mmetsp:Transcript_27393/g.88033  ORF Transcript_27393/g.88033 Transcript_27393/m.88033 type:complete len:221 (-) Transcript_27393:1193-1855(-)
MGSLYSTPHAHTTQPSHWSHCGPLARGTGGGDIGTCTSGFPGFLLLALLLHEVGQPWRRCCRGEDLAAVPIAADACRGAHVGDHDQADGANAEPCEVSIVEHLNEPPREALVSACAIVQASKLAQPLLRRKRVGQDEHGLTDEKGVAQNEMRRCEAASHACNDVDQRTSSTVLGEDHKIGTDAVRDAQGHQRGHEGDEKQSDHDLATLDCFDPAACGAHQ